MRIRPALPEDAFDIAKVHVASWRSTYPGIVPQSYLDALDVEDFAARWQGRVLEAADSVIHVAERDGTICGFAAGGRARRDVTGFPGELYAIYLPTEEQRRGTGALLFRSVVAALMQSGWSGMYVWVLEQNTARRFYERMGGVELALKERIEIGGASLMEVAYGWSEVSVLTASR